MKTDMTATVTVDSFLLQVRKRLWSLRILEAGRTVFWSASLLLLVLSGIHLLVVPITITMIFAAIITPVLLLLPFVAHQRPSLAQCAARADRAFQGHALMTTALECLHKPKEAGDFATRIVLQQADNAARSWLPEISQRLRSSATSSTVFPTIPLFFALVLLSLPGAENEVVVAQVTPGVTPPAAAANNLGLEPGTGDITALRRAIVDESAVRSQPSSENQSDRTFAPSQSDTTTVAELPATPEQASEWGGVAGAGGDDGDLPGNAIARSTLPPETPLAMARFGAGENVVLQRTGPIFAAGAAPGADYRDGKERKLESPNRIRAAAAPDSLTHSTILSPAQAAHAMLYLEESGKDND